MAFELTSIYNERRPLSWSALSLFEWNKKMWYDKYVSGEASIMTPELEFGSYIDKKIQFDESFLPKLIRYPILQHKMRIDWDGIPLVGYADTYRPKDGRRHLALRDYKTGKAAKPWTQQRADEHGQLTMYLFMIWLEDKSINIERSELYIDWLPTHIDQGKIALIEPVKIHSFKTHRSMRDLLAFGKRINNTWKEMQEYASAAEEGVVEMTSEQFV